MDLYFTHIYEIARRQLGITADEYRLVNYVDTWASFPGSARRGWCNRTLSQKADFIGITPRGLTKMQNKMIALDLIEKDPLTSHTRTTLKWFHAVKSARENEPGSEIFKLNGEQSSRQNREQSSAPQGTKFPGNREQSSVDPGNNVPPHNNVFNTEFNNEFVLIDSDPTVSVLTPVEIVVGHLNDVLKPARPYSIKTKKTVEHVNARIRDGYNADDICKVIDLKFAEWFGDPKMEQYIRPETLFGTGKFESYLIAAENWIQRGRPSFNKNNNTRNNGKSNIADADQSFAGAFK